MTDALLIWAQRNRVSHQALHELRELMGMNGQESPAATVTGEPHTESWVQSTVRIEAASKGIKLWRNNVGVLQDLTGRPVRYGLANDSKRLNETIKSGDLIGWRPVTITDTHLGRCIAQFVSRECKPADWRYTGTDRERAQAKWASLVLADGGDASFVTGPGTL